MPSLKPLTGPATLLIGLLTLAGCSTSPPAPPTSHALAVKPQLHIDHGGAVDLASGYMVQARQLESQGLLEDATRWWAQAAERAPRQAEIQHGLGLCLARQGRLPESVEALRAAATLAPDDARILNNLGQALKLLGQQTEALALFRAALQADPQHAQARYNLVMLERPDLSMALSATSTASAATATPLTTLLTVQQAPNRPPLPLLTASPNTTSPVDGTSKLAVIPLNSLAAHDAGVVASKMSVTLTGLTVEVFNGNGITGAAKGLSRTLAQHGVQANRIANMARYDIATTRIIYRPGKIDQAQQLARLLPTHVELSEASPQQQPDMRADVRVVLGHDAQPSPYTS